MAATAGQASILGIRHTQWVDADGNPTLAAARSMEQLQYVVGKVDEAARSYTALDTGTATTARCGSSSAAK